MLASQMLYVPHLILNFLPDPLALMPYLVQMLLTLSIFRQNVFEVVTFLQSIKPTKLFDSQALPTRNLVLEISTLSKRDHVLKLTSELPLPVFCDLHHSLVLNFIVNWLEILKILVHLGDVICRLGSLLQQLASGLGFGRRVKHSYRSCWLLV